MSIWVWVGSAPDTLHPSTNARQLSSCGLWGPPVAGPARPEMIMRPPTHPCPACACERGPAGRGGRGPCPPLLAFRVRAMPAHFERDHPYP